MLLSVSFVEGQKRTLINKKTKEIGAKCTSVSQSE
jgi:hypothetical protein